MNLDPHQLAAFAAVLAEGSFERAARRLHVTPSAVSQRIKALEERLGQVLLRRTAPAQATAAGQLLLRHAEKVALLETEVLGQLGVATGDADGAGTAVVRVPIVVNADSLDTWFVAVFDALPGIAPIAPVALDVRAEDQDHSVTLLRDGVVVAGVSASAEAVQGCRVEPLGVMRYRAVAAPEFVRAHFAHGLTAAALGGAPALAFNRKDALQDQFAARFGAAARWAPTHYVPSTVSFYEAGRRGLGWGLMPEAIAAAALAAGDLVDLAPAAPLDVPLYWHRWRIASAALDAVSGLVRQTAARFLHPR